MTIAFRKGCYGVRQAETAEDLAQCRALRHHCFFGSEGQDKDLFDDNCRHIMIAGQDGLVATFRVAVFKNGSEMDLSYTAQSYDVSTIFQKFTPIMEVGRFCIAPDIADPNVLRLCWGALAQIVSIENVKFLFGCTSFTGVDPTLYLDGFHLLAKKHLAPKHMRPSVKADEIIAISAIPGVSPKQALSQIPPLLRSYLAMGGWVSDHAVIDHDLNTLHVFTGLDVSTIPKPRADALRAIVNPN